MDPMDASTYCKGKELAQGIMYGARGLKKSATKEEDQKKDGNDMDNTDIGDHTVYAVGNCHIDTAWLWPYAETRRKVVRSWASQLRLMELYNKECDGMKYHFTASQAQQYQWLLEDCPELFGRIQSMAKKEGTFHIVGGTWVCIHFLCVLLLYGDMECSIFKD